MKKAIVSSSRRRLKSCQEDKKSLQKDVDGIWMKWSKKVANPGPRVKKKAHAAIKGEKVGVHERGQKDNCCDTGMSCVVR